MADLPSPPPFLSWLLSTNKNKIIKIVWRRATAGKQGSGKEIKREIQWKKFEWENGNSNADRRESKLETKLITMGTIKQTSRKPNDARMEM